MQKAIWVLAIVCCLSTITLTVAITHADSPSAIPNELKARTFVLVNEKGETMVTLVGEAAWGTPGLSVVLGKEDDAMITLMRLPNGALVISAQEGKRKSRMDFLLDTNGSSNLTLSGPDGSVSLGVNAISPYINLQNTDGTYLNLHTHNGMVFSGTKKTMGSTTKPAMVLDPTTRPSQE